MRKVYIGLVFLALLMGGVIVGKAYEGLADRRDELLAAVGSVVERDKFQQAMAGVLSEWISVVQTLYGRLSQDAVHSLSMVAAREHMEIMRSLKERDVLVREACALVGEAPLAEVLRVLVQAENTVFEQQGERHRYVFENLGVADQKLLKDEIFPEMLKGGALIRPSIDSGVAYQLAVEFPEYAESYVSKKCEANEKKLHLGYEFVLRMSQEGSVVHYSKSYRSIKK